MRKAYHVLNDYSLEELTAQEQERFTESASGLSARKGWVNGCRAVYYRNDHGELVYVDVESGKDLNGYELRPVVV